MLNTQFIEATNLGDAWFQTLFRMLEEGRVFKIDRGSYAGQKRLEFFNVVIDIKFPGAQPLLPQIPEQYGIPNPVDSDYLDSYLPYLMTGELKSGESYTYGQRLTKERLDPIWIDEYDKDHFKDILIQDKGAWESKNVIDTKSSSLRGIRRSDDFLNQIELLIWTYKNKGHRNNQMVLQVAQPNDMLLQDPPHFRSWDLWNGLPANLAAIQMLKEYVAGEIGVGDGKIIANSKGLHVYDYVFDLAKCLRMKEDMVLKDGIM
jgi:thymidylate synthase